MTEPTEAANDRWTQLLVAAGDPHIAGRRLVQEVSDAAAEVSSFLAQEWVSENTRNAGKALQGILAPFILPEPVDPLVEIMRSLDGSWNGDHIASHLAETLRVQLAKRGLQIVPVPAA